MRRKDKEVINREWIEDVIRGSLVCHLALTKDNVPYLLPISFGYDGQCLYFHTALAGTKIPYLLAGNPVCFEFERHVEIKSDPDIACRWSCHYESVIGYGVISEVISDPEKQDALNAIMRQYSGKNWTFDAESVSKVRLWKLQITSMTGKRSPANKE